MRYAEAIQTIDTEKALGLLGIETKGLPYLCAKQLELLSPFTLVTFEWLFSEKKEIMLSVAQNLKTYHRFA